MRLLKGIFNRLKRELKFSLSDPANFKEVWSFNSNGIRVLSLLLVFLLLFGFGVLYLFSGWFTEDSGQGKIVSRTKLEEQASEIESLKETVNNQERYINSIRLILLGEVPLDSDIDSLNDISSERMDSLYKDASESERKLAAEVKNDMRTSSNDDTPLSFFTAPVKGVVSQHYKARDHHAVDIVTEKGATVVACLSGTVIYSGYTRKDGNILIIEHSDGFISVYKHNKSVFKKIGSKVRIGDPIAIVGNTGENSDGPHLHFELWYNQAPVNPENYMDFKK